MAKPDLGTKRLCASCGSKFYDLNRTPIVCPKCDTEFVIPVVPTRSRPDAKAAVVAPVAEAVVPETADAEFVSLEDAEAEQQGKKPAAAAGEEAGDEVADDDTIDDAAFIEEQEEGAPDVTEIIGETIEKEEEH